MASATTKRIGDTVSLQGKIAEGDKPSGKKTVVGKVEGYGVPIWVTTAYVEKAGGKRATDD